MKLYAPEYYKNFVCIADKCRHSCCVGWEIDIDRNTLEKYNALSCDYGREILKSVVKRGTPHFRLLKDGKCTHLDGNGLCKIITNLGEEYLCDICREHPRFYNETVKGVEVGLGMACEESARIILSSDGYSNLVEVGEEYGEKEEDLFDIVPIRNKIFEMLSDRLVPYGERIGRICREFCISPSALTDEKWRRVIENLEYLDKENKRAFLNYSSNGETPKEYEKILERGLAYFVYRHLSQSENKEEVKYALGFCLFCERLFASLIKSKGGVDLNGVYEIGRIISEEIEYSEDNVDVIKSAYFKEGQ